MKRKRIAVGLYAYALALLFCASAFAQAPSIAYRISIPEPHTHYVNVQMTVDGAPDTVLDFRMPVWTPGSYLIREFAKNIQEVAARDAQQKTLPFKKVNKNTWRVQTAGSGQVTLSYRVYANELSVRTSHVDASHANINGTSVFMFLDGYLDRPSTVTIVPPAEWREISTTLEPLDDNPWVRTAPDYDVLVDSPIEIGNQEIIEFTAAGVPHEIVIHGEGNYVESRLVDDFKAIVEETTKLMGENPCDRFIFFLHNADRRGGGLEHLNSTSIIVNRWTYTGNSYTAFLGTVTHEYFHVWNVKRLRPEPLGPFDYSSENYTELLWVAEGITTYYDDLILKRANLIGMYRYFEIVTRHMELVENAAGHQIQSLAEASFDAWIKHYRPDENSLNSTISYYTKGALAGLLLDLEILFRTQGKKSLDDVMRLLYEKTFIEKNRGFTTEEFIEAAEAVSGKDLTRFFKDYVFGTKPLDYSKYLGYAGLKLSSEPAVPGRPDLGADLYSSDGRLRISTIDFGSSAWDFGLNSGDEIISVNGYRTPNQSTFSQVLNQHAPGDSVELVISRDGMIQSLPISLRAGTDRVFRIDKKEKAFENRESHFQAMARNSMGLTPEQPPSLNSPGLRPVIEPAAPRKKERASSAVSGTFFFSLSKIVMMVTAYAIYITLGHLLTVEEFGIFGIIGGLNLLFDLVLITGTTQTVARFVSQNEQLAHSVSRKALQAQTLIGGSLCLVFIAAAEPVATYLFRDPHLAAHLRVIGLIILLYAFYGIFVGYLNGMKYFKSQAGFDVVLSVLKMVLIIAAVYFGYQAIGAAAGFVLAALGTLLLAAVLVRPIKSGDAEARVTLKEILAFESPIILFALVLNITLSLDLFLVKALSDPAQSGILTGYYTAVGSLSRVAYQSVIGISLVVFPLISNVTFTMDKKKISEYITNAMRYGLMITLFFGVAISSNAGAIIGFMYPDEYVIHASLPLSIVVFGMAGYGLFMIMTTILAGAGQPKTALYFGLLTIGMHIGFNFFTIPEFKMIGAAAGTCAALMASAIMAGFYVRKKFGALIGWKSFLRISGGAGVLYVATTPFEADIFLIMPKIALMFLLFFLTLLALGEFSREERSKIFRRIRFTRS